MMQVQSNHLATPAVGRTEKSRSLPKEPCQPLPEATETRKVASFIQRFYLFGTNGNGSSVAATTTQSEESKEQQQPKTKKVKASDQTVEQRPRGEAESRKTPESSSNASSSSSSSDNDPSPTVQYPSYSVQRLRQFWTNRLLSGGQNQTTGGGSASGASIDTLVRKTKSATIGAPIASRTAGWKTSSGSPAKASRFHRNGSIGRSGRRRQAHDPLAAAWEGLPPAGPPNAHKRTSNAALLSPDRETVQRQGEKRQCVRVAPVQPSDSFPLATSTPTGSQIHWARRTELLGIRALTQEERRASKMPLRVENYVNNFIGVDIQSVGGGEASEMQKEQEATELPSAIPHADESVQSGTERADSSLAILPTQEVAPVAVERAVPSSGGRKGNTPTRKISFMNNISPYNRRLLAGNGTKVAALTSKFNQMIQQDTGLLEQVKKRGGYIHKCGNVAYKVLEDTGASVGVDTGGLGVTSRNSGGRASLRKRLSGASANGSNRTEESSDELSTSSSSKSSSVRKTGVKKRPSLRKNIYRRPEWAETGRSGLGVRKALELFEPNVQHNTPPAARAGRKVDASSHGDTGKPPPGRSKPKVPDKSEQLLQKTKVGVRSSRKGDGTRPLSSECNATSEREDECPQRRVEEENLGPQENHGNTSTEEADSQSTPTNCTGTTLSTPASKSSSSPSTEAAPANKTTQPEESATNGAASKEPEPTVPPKEMKEKKKSKSTVSKIYERLTFRSSKKIQLDTSGSRSGSAKSEHAVVLREESTTVVETKGEAPTRRSFISTIEIPTIQIDEPPPEAEASSTESEVSEQKILEAICTANHRIDNLSKSFNDLTLNDADEDEEEPPPVVLEPPQAGKQDQLDVGSGALQVRPNASFLFRGTSGAAGSRGLVAESRNASAINIVEAVNTVVINKAVSMDDHHFPCVGRASAARTSLNELRSSAQQRDLEDDYEPVTKPEEPSIGGQQQTVDDEPPQPMSCSSPSISIDLTELTSKIESFIHKSKRESENIYQSISRNARTTTGGRTDNLLIPEDTISINSYESFENYESIEHELGCRSSANPAGQDTAAREEDTYEICSPPPDLPPDLPPDRDDARNDLTLPQPKRNLSSSPKTLPKHLQITYQSNYEKIKYSKIPPRPPKPDEVPLPPRNNASGSGVPAAPSTNGVPGPASPDRLNLTLESISSAELPPLSPGGDLLDKSPHGPQEEELAARSQENIYEENIYDTIRSADGADYDDPACGGSSELEVPPVHPVIRRPGEHQRKHTPSPPADTVSLVSSNCYESIGSRLELVRHLALNRRTIGGSTTTLASDHITNSLYGTTGGLASLTPPSERGSDTSNSADWTDISDEDEGEQCKQFVVVRECKRNHHTPLRSRKLARISHQKIDDDSDHHYESLHSIGSGDLQAGRRPPFEQQPIVDPEEDEFDSFDSDDTDAGDGGEEEDEDDEDEDEYEDEEGRAGQQRRRRQRADSGVDIRNAKLPDPPPSSSQVYVLVQKIKNLGTLSRSEIAKGFHKLSKKGRKPPADAKSTGTNPTSPRPFRLPVLPLVGGSGPAPKPPPEDYEPAVVEPAKSSPRSSVLSCSSSSSPACAASSSPSVPRSTSESSNVSGQRREQPPKKSKSSKSLRSKLRKSLVPDSSTSSSGGGGGGGGGLNIGSSFNGSRSTFYVSTTTMAANSATADVDSGIFNGTIGGGGGGSGEVDGAGRRKSLALGSTTSGRPSIPPPPPPATKAPPATNRKLGATSWYAECAVFMQPPNDGSPGSGGEAGGPGKTEGSNSPRSPALAGKDRPGTGGSASSWYADMMYQTTSGASVASSSESSGVSTGGEGGPGDDHSHSMFVNEPLYQIYNAAKLESITRDIDAEISGQALEGEDEEEQELYDDGYEKISERQRRRRREQEQDPAAGGKETSSGGSSTDGDDRSESSTSRRVRKSARPTALELIEPHGSKMRTLWCEVPEVRSSEILATLTPTEKRLQEAKFEILTSEASYLKSLNLLRTHFVNHPAFRDQRVLAPADRKTLFSSILPVQECSDRLLCDLEHCWQDNIMLLGLSHSIHKHAEKHFHVYVAYCEHQARIDRTLKALRANRPDFARTLAELESDPVCCGLSLASFLMLPMQRITRMRLLLDAVLQRCHPELDDEFASWEKTFVLINRILTQCNDAAHRSEQAHEMERLSRQIEFPTHVRPLPIVPCGIGAAPSSMHRKLEKRGELVHLLWRGDDAKLTFGKKFSKSNVYAFLFTDLLVLTKKKSDDSFLVVDYCQRALLTVSSGDVLPGLPAKEMQTIGKNLIIMTLLENHEGKTVEMILSCPSETERERWLTVTEPPASENPDEKIYEQWNCPQVIAVHPYQALQPDELDLDIKDVVNVHRKMADGWYEGERIRDGAVGWFPSNYTKEIPSAHIRAKHIKQRHMLLTYTSKYIDTAVGKGSHHHHHHHGHHHYQNHYGKK